VGVKAVEQAEAEALSVEELGLDSQSIGLDAPEALAATLRRAASFLCPTTGTHLTNSVLHSLEWLVGEIDGLPQILSDMLESLVGYGDLLELANLAGSTTRGMALFLASPAYVRRSSGSYMLLGIRPEGQPLVGEEVQPYVACERHNRSIEPRPGLDLGAVLNDYGLRPVPLEQWLRSPRLASASEVVKEFNTRLDSAGASGMIEGLTILDPNAPATYYRERWRFTTRRDSGRFVARRPRAYGADLWCYADLESGVTTRVIDLAIEAGLSRGCDEAWRLQAAIDSVRGYPQRIRSRPALDGHDRVILDLFSPPPAWFQRRWDALGLPVGATGSLLSYSFKSNEVEGELRFAATALWLAPNSAGGEEESGG
jgi:hypothetical protein